MRFLIASALALALLMGCQQPQPKTPVDDLVASFEADRSRYAVEYGLRAVSSKNSTITSIDCMVFEQAALATPTSLGQASALVDAMDYRSFLGCNDETLTLTRYETARRQLRDIWVSSLASLPSAMGPLAQQTRMGELIESQLNKAANEAMACAAEAGRDARINAKNSDSIAYAQSICRTNYQPQPKEICRQAWRVATAHLQAGGAFDDQAYLMQLLSRYRLMINYCSPQAPNEYVAIHAATPPHLFQSIAFRLQKPLDPIMQCTIARVAERAGSTMPANPAREHIECAAKWNYQSLYLEETPPWRFNEETVKNGVWLFDPTKTQDDPELWTLGDCERQLIGVMQQQGLNPASPKGLKRYCKELRRRQ